MSTSNGYFGASDAIRRALKKTNRVNTITHGDLSDVDLGRMNIYPLAHVVTQSATFDKTTTEYTFLVTLLDIIDFDRNDPDLMIEPFYGTDNAQDILHDLGITIELMLDHLRRGDLWNDMYRLDDAVTGTAFTNYGENSLAGWSFSLTTTTINAAVNDGLS